MTQQSLPCPVCQTQIVFDVNGLLRGEKYTCPNCNSSIGLGEESKSSVQEAMDKFNEAKKNTSREK
jgi:transposase-like protein